MAALEDVDTEILGVWVTAGISLFKRDRLPSLSTVTEEARKVLLVMMYERYGGNITYVADALRTSRRSAREQLRRAGVHGGPRVVAERSEPEPESGDDEDEREPGSGDEISIEVMEDDEDGETHPIRVEDDGEE